MRITVETVIDDETTKRFWELYRVTFEPLRSRAATRHVMYEYEFTAMVADPRIQKHVAWDAEGQPIGMLAVTTDLTAVSWVSPEFYEARYPEHCERGTLHYVCFMVVHPDRQGSVVAARLMRRFTAAVADARGMLAIDVCRFNDETVHVPRAVAGAGRRAGTVHQELVDTQRFYTFTLTVAEPASSNVVDLRPVVSLPAPARVEVPVEETYGAAA